MGKGGSERKQKKVNVMSEDAPVNVGASGWPSDARAYLGVRRMQTKLHGWAATDGGRRFDDLWNLVCDPAFLTMAWERVAGNKGSKTPGVDRVTVARISSGVGVEEFLRNIRAQLRAGEFRPVPVRQVMIPKASGKLRKLGIPTVTDRVVQAALKLVLEPIFEADFKSCSYGFRPNRRAQDAVAEIHHFASKSYEWVLEADIEACFDMIDHTALMDRLRCRIGDKRVLALVKAFLKAGVLTTVGTTEGTITGTPQGGILSPLLANIALSVLDDEFARRWDHEMGTAGKRAWRRDHGKASYRLIRYADDFVIVVKGQPRTRRAVASRGGRRTRPDGVASVAGEDPRGPHRPRVRLPRFPHPTDAETRQQQVVRLHPAREEGDRLDQTAGEDHDLQEHPAPGPGIPHGLSRAGAAGMGELLPVCGGQSNLRRDRLLHV